MLKLMVGTDGSVKHAAIASSQPTGVFDKVSLDASRQWHFEPRRDAKGQPVESYVMVPVLFAANNHSH